MVLFQMPVETLQTKLLFSIPQSICEDVYWAILLSRNMVFRA